MLVAARVGNDPMPEHRRGMSRVLRSSGKSTRNVGERLKVPNNFFVRVHRTLALSPSSAEERLRARWGMDALARLAGAAKTQSSRRLISCAARSADTGVMSVIKIIGAMR